MIPTTECMHTTLQHPDIIDMYLLLKHPYIVQQTGNENTQTYQVEGAILISHQFSLLIYDEICSSLRAELQFESVRVDNIH